MHSKMRGNAWWDMCKHNARAGVMWVFLPYEYTDTGVRV